MSKRVNKRFLVILTAAVGATGLAAIGAEMYAKHHHSIEKMMTDANASYDKKDWTTAASEYSAIVNLKSDDQQALLKLGDCFNDMTSLDDDYLAKARGDWNHVLSLDPHNKEALERLLESWKEQMQMDQSTSTLDQTRLAANALLEVDPGNPQAEFVLNSEILHKWLSPSTIDDGELRSMMAALDQMYAKNPANSELLNYSCTAKIVYASQLSDPKSKQAQDLIDQAKARMAAALQARPKDPEIHWAAFQIYLQLARTSAIPKDDANKLLAEQIGLAQKYATSADKDYILINLNQVDWERRHGELDQARELVTKLVKDHPDSAWARLKASDVLKPDEAIAILSHPIAPSTAEGFLALVDKIYQSHALYHLVILRLNQADAEKDPEKRKLILAQAERDFVQLEASPSKTIMKGNYVAHVRARFLLEKGDYIGAIQAYDSLINNIKGTSMEEAPMIILEQVNLYEKTQQFGPAMGLLQTVVNGNPDNVDLCAELANLQLTNDRLDDCQKTMDHLLKLAPDDGRAVTLMLRLRVKQNKLAEARTIYDKLPEKGSDPGKTMDDLVAKYTIAKNVLNDNAEVLRLTQIIYANQPKKNNLSIVYVLAQALIDASKRSEAKKLIDDTLKDNPHDTALMLMHIELSDMSDSEKFQFKKDVLNQQIDLYVRYLQLAQLEKQPGGSLEDAAGYLQQALGLSTHHDDPNATSQLYQVDVELHRYDEAAPLMEQMAKNSPAPNGDLIRARFAIAQGDYGKAIDLAHEIVKKFPQFNSGYLVYADALRGAGKYSDAIRQYTLALGKQRNPEAENGLITCYEAQKDTVNEGLELDKAVLSFPESPAFRERRLDFQASHGHAEIALHDRQDLLDRNREDPMAWLALARTYELLARSNAGDTTTSSNYFQQASDVLDKAIEKFPDDQQMYVEIVPILHELKQDSRADALLSQLGQRPKFKDSPLVDDLLFQQDIRESKNDAAEKILEEEYEVSKHSLSVELRLASYLSEQGKYDQALKVLDDHADDLHVILQRFQTLAAAGQMNKAELLLQEKLKERPDSLPLIAGLANFYIATRQYDLALYRLNTILAQKPNNEPTLLLRASVFASKTPPDLKSARADLDAAQTINPYDPRVILQLSNLDLAQGDVSGAHTALSNALKDNPGQPDLRRSLVQIDMPPNPPDWDEVINLATAAENLPSLSGDPQWYAIHAQALNALRRTDEAIGSIQKAIQLDSDPKHLTYEIPYLQILLSDSATSDNFQDALSKTKDLLNSGMNDWWLYLYHGLANAKLHNNSAALEDMDKALKLTEAKGGNEGASMNVLRAMAKNVDPTEAIRRIGKHDDPTGAWAMLALEISQQSKDQRLIRAALDQVMNVQAKPGISADHRIAMLVAAGEGYEALADPDHADARKAYEAALEINPNEVVVLNNLAYLLADAMDQAPQAKLYAKKAYDLLMNSAGKVDAGVLDTYGWVLVLCGGDDAARGITMLKQAIASRDDLIEAHCHLGEAYMRESRASEAQVEGTRAKELIDQRHRQNLPVNPDLESRVQGLLQAVKDHQNAAGG